MRLLHVHSGNLYGGIETMLVTLARHRRLAPGLDQSFALCFEGRLAGELRDTGVEVAELGAARARNPASVVRARRRLRARLAGGRFDRVLVHASGAHALFAGTGTRAGVPLVGWVHGGAGGRHWLERLARRNPPALAIANSRHTATAVPKLFPGVPVTVIHPPLAPPDPVADAERRRLRDELGAAPGEAVVVQVSRMEVLKGHVVHLEALGRLADRPGWRCWMVGGGERPAERALDERLRRRAGELGIGDRVQWLGERRDVPRLLAAADLFCQPNTAPEAFGLAYVEALYAGLPVVATDLGGASEIVTAECGRLVPRGEPETVVPALAEALGELLADPGLRARLGAAGPARARALCHPEVLMPRLVGALSRART
jgi:glycosyltransferase involved in cell wall biosynthesis